MPVIEYKLHAINSQKHMQAPHWVTDGGNWYNPADKTLVGWTPAETDRDYYIPDTVTTLTKAELNTRMLAIHAITKYQKRTPEERDSNGDPIIPENYSDTFEDMTEAEVTTMSNDWYDAYVAGK